MAVQDGDCDGLISRIAAGSNPAAATIPRQLVASSPLGQREGTVQFRYGSHRRVVQRKDTTLTRWRCWFNSIRADHHSHKQALLKCEEAAAS